jgi:hypothetical protein
VDRQHLEGEWAVHCIRARTPHLRHTDASDTGWGGWILLPEGERRQEASKLLLNLQSRSLLPLSIKEATRRLQTGFDVYGAFTPSQAAKSSTWREMYGALRLLQALATLLRGGTYSLHFDNQGAVYLLGGVVRDHPDKIFGGSRKPELQQLVVSILDLAANHNVLIRELWTAREWSSELTQIHNL